MKNGVRSSAWGWALIVALMIVVYFPALHGGFIWDDDQHIVQNPAVMAPDGLRSIWSSFVLPVYYPLTFTALWLVYQVWGANPVPYHVVTLALHTVDTLLLLFVLRRLNVRGAWIIAAFWAIHPVNVESVAWATELKNTLSATWFFASLLCFFRYEQDLQRPWFAAALLCFAAALLSKSSTVVLPAVLLLCAWWQRGREARTDIVRTLPFFALSLSASFVAVWAQVSEKLSEGVARDWSLRWPERLIVAGQDIGFYVGKIICPCNLMFIYPRWSHDARVLTEWLPLAGVAAAGIVLWRSRHTGMGRAGLFGMGYFVIALLPVLGLFDQHFYRYSFVADHFQYLASIGLIGVVVGAGAAISERLGEPGRGLGTLTVTTGLLVMGVCSWRQTHIYHDAETLWRDTLAKNPNAWIAHNNLGVLLQGMGRDTEALKEYDEALHLKPDYAEAHNNLGFALSHMGRIKEAIDQYEAALRIDPDDTEAHNNFGNALSQLGQDQEAIAQYEAALRIKPDDVDARNNLGTVLLRLGKAEDAIAQWEKVLRIKPDYAEADNNLGVASARLGRVKEAMGYWEQALRMKPDYADAHYNLGVALEQAGRTPEAIGHYEQALRIKPDLAGVQNRLARLRTIQ